MPDSTSRTLRLLSLLQRRRFWPGPELADRLGISDRTLRRDVLRLRELGYSIDTERGADGGYRLGETANEVALLLDDDEATALAAALHTSAVGSSELAEAALGALNKVLAMMKPAQRRRAEAVHSTTAFGAPDAGSMPPLATLDAVAAACRDRVRLSFAYVAADHAASERFVEPLQLVSLGTRWYLVAFDLDRDDWRTFRLDRMGAPSPARNRFPDRTPPADDLHEYVRAGLSRANSPIGVVIEVEGDGDAVRSEYGRWVTVTDAGDGWARVAMDVDTFRWPTHIVANLDMPFRVIEPAGFADHLRDLAERWSAP